MIGMVVNEVTGPRGMKDLASVLGSHDLEKEKKTYGRMEKATPDK